MKIMIVGANFVNKGAQSMLFIAVDEIKKRYPDAEVLFASTDIIKNVDEYAFTYVYYSKEAKNIALGRKALFIRMRQCIKDTVKWLIGRRILLWKYMDLSRCLNEIDMIIDISGFNLGSGWSTEIHEAYLDNIRLAKKYDIPIVLMPQSFGSFDYPEDKQYLIREMQELLPYAKVIFAREKEGCQMLKDTFQLTNVKLSTDLVLQNQEIDLKHIYSNPPKMDLPKIGSGTVGVIPNIQCFNHGNRERILEIYRAVIKDLLAKEKKVCIFRHSSEDMEMCRAIYEMFSNNENVHLLENDFSCVEFDQFVKQYDFVICSRYHGIVHSYRNYVPCVLLGWAVKYRELAEIVGQARYSFDITDDKLSVQQIKSAIDNMCGKFGNESEVIKKHLETIQKDNCFNILSEGVI